MKAKGANKHSWWIKRNCLGNIARDVSTHGFPNAGLIALTFNLLETKQDISLVGLTFFLLSF